MVGIVVVVTITMYTHERKMEKTCTENKKIFLPAARGPEIYSASNRNEYQKYKYKYIPGAQTAVGA
jgi:hypothetical protein